MYGETTELTDDLIESCTTEGSNIDDVFGTNPIMYSPLQFPLNAEQSGRGRSSVLLSPERPVDKCWMYQTWVKEVTMSAAELWGSANCRQKTEPLRLACIGFWLSLSLARILYWHLKASDINYSKYLQIIRECTQMWHINLFLIAPRGLRINPLFHFLLLTPSALYSFLL